MRLDISQKKNKNRLIDNINFPLLCSDFTSKQMEKRTKREIDPRAATWKCVLSDYGIEWRDELTRENKRGRGREWG